MTLLITGGAGFIGSNFIHLWLDSPEAADEQIVNLDKLTYAGNMANHARLRADGRHHFVHGDIGDRELVGALLRQHQVRRVVNFAAESHVDRSIHGASDFIQTNVVGTFAMLEAVRSYWSELPNAERVAFRFLHVSTDEVYGSLAPGEPAFSETNPYAPNSPYAASKAASDHLVRSWRETYGLPTIITHCSNNYGPYHFPEKLIPLIIGNALAGKPLPIYGDGLHVRDWLFVEDHCRALALVLSAGHPGETYNIGGCNEMANLEVVRNICGVLDELSPRPDGRPYAEQITYVADRPGHDRRYAVDTGKIARELGWQPIETFEAGIRKTVSWYLENQDWVAMVTSGTYRDWVRQHYGNAA